MNNNDNDIIIISTNPQVTCITCSVWDYVAVFTVIASCITVRSKSWMWQQKELLIKAASAKSNPTSVSISIITSFTHLSSQNCHLVFAEGIGKKKEKDQLRACGCGYSKEEEESDVCRTKLEFHFILFWWVFFCAVSHLNSWKYEKNTRKLLKFDGQFLSLFRNVINHDLSLENNIILNKRPGFHLAKGVSQKERSAKFVYRPMYSYLFFQYVDLEMDFIDCLHPDCSTEHRGEPMKQWEFALRLSNLLCL